MMRIIINGACGRMGQKLRAAIAAESGVFSVAALVDISGADGAITSFDNLSVAADAIIDFSNHACAPALMSYAVAHGLPVVVATTGHTAEEQNIIKDAAKSIPVFMSANMSLGIALLAELARKTASVFPDADIEIVEVHHNQKIDAPSGTAIMLAEAITEVRPESTCVFGRHGYAKRSPEEIGIHSLRLGNVLGEHEVIVNAGSQTITLKHEINDRSVLAEGALRAAEFIVSQPAGFYNMKNLLAGK